MPRLSPFVPLALICQGMKFNSVLSMRLKVVLQLGIPKVGEWDQQVIPLYHRDRIWSIYARSNSWKPAGMSSAGGATSRVPLNSVEASHEIDGFFSCSVVGKPDQDCVEIRVWGMELQDYGDYWGPLQPPNTSPRVRFLSGHV